MMSRKSGFVNSFLIRRLIINFVQSHSPEEEGMGYLYAVIIFVVTVVQSICLNQHNIRVMTVGMRLRTAVMSIVYKKVGHGVGREDTPTSITMHW